MLPSSSKAIAVKDIRASSNQQSSEDTDVTVSWLDRNMKCFPNEALVNIFSFLELEDIVQVQNTCRRFRSVVLANQLDSHTIFFRQFSTLFRKQCRQALSWQISVIKSGSHPFITSLPGQGREDCFTAEQHSGLFCYYALRAMMSTPKYKAINVFDKFCPCFDLRSRFCTANRLLSRSGSDCLNVISQDSNGSWKERAIEGFPYKERSCRRKFSFSADGRYFFTVIDRRTIEVRKYDHDRWQVTKTLEIEGAQSLMVSPSGKYLAVFTKDGIESIRCFDDVGDWQSMRMAEDTRIDPDFEWHEFSPSEQHLVFRYKQKLVILSQDSHGCWHIPWQTDSNTGIGYFQLCSSGSWLLFAYEANGIDDPGSVEMIRLDPGGRCVPWQTIFPQYHKLTFSPAGKYLISQNGVARFMLWQLGKSGQWGFYGEFTGYSAPLERRNVYVPTNFERDTVTLSSCDQYLLTSSPNGLVKIWEQDGQGVWRVRGSKQHRDPVSLVKFSGSGVHALTVDRWGVHIWGRNEEGLWSVKGIITGSFVENAYFHPVADHLLVINSSGHTLIWEIRQDDSSGKSVWGQIGSMF